jgi:hypothetical protein
MKNEIEYKVIDWQQNGKAIEPPDGFNVGDYFAHGKYLGPDSDGIEPVLQIRYEDGIHMTQYFSNEGGAWFLVGYDGVQRDIPGTGEIAKAFADRVESGNKRKRGYRLDSAAHRTARLKVDPETRREPVTMEWPLC